MRQIELLREHGAVELVGEVEPVERQHLGAHPIRATLGIVEIMTSTSTDGVADPAQIGRDADDAVGGDMAQHKVNRGEIPLRGKGDQQESCVLR